MRLKKLVFAALCSLTITTNAMAETQVSALLETPARLKDVEGHINDPDDPAIWIHPKDPTKSLVIASLKKGGIDVYDLNGYRIQHITPKPVPNVAENPARFNNVDISYISRIEECDWDLTVVPDRQNDILRIFNIFNNGDISYIFRLEECEYDLAVASDRQNDMLRIFTISPARLANGEDPLVEVTAEEQDTIFNDDPEEVAEGDFTSYGLAVTQPYGSKNRVAVYVSQNDRTTLAKLILEPMSDGKIGYEVEEKHNLPEVFTLPDGSRWNPAHDDDGEMSHVEGIVVDDENGVVYFAQEKVGIWKGSLQETFEDVILIDKVNEFGVPYTRTWNPDEEEYDIELQWDLDKDYGSDYLAEDVEGLTMYDAGDGEGYLIASSQGSNQFAVYNRETNQYIGNFSIVDNTASGVDGVQECDGAMVTNLNLGGDFSSGLLVVQDGENTPFVYDEEGEAFDNANFKFIPWERIANAMGLSINNQ